MDYRYYISFINVDDIKDKIEPVMDIKGKKIVVIGTARSGLAAADLALKLGAKVSVSEEKKEEVFDENFKKWALANKITIETGGHTKGFIENSDLVILSPGVRIDALVVQWAKEKNIPVIAEIEFAFYFCKVPIIAVTGSNGKTTVSTLISNILENAGKKVCLCGNIGKAFSQFVLNLQGIDYIVLEVSSFQLEAIVEFRPHIGVLLNISQNHLDRHKDMHEYFDAKKRLFMNQNKNNFAVLNADDPKMLELSKELKAQVLFFNSSDDKKLNLLNPNFSAAYQAAKILNIDDVICQKTFAEFKGVEHRLEWVRTLNGVDFINDSKSTTAEATRWALENINKPLFLICGGRNKKIDFSTLKSLVQRKVKKIFVIGEAKGKIKQTFGEVVTVIEGEHLNDAVLKARSEAREGDCILLSPMCTSFDMFLNFEERGKIFKEIVNNLN